MVDSISNAQSNSISELTAGQLQKNQQVEALNQEAANTTQTSNVTDLFDQAEISPDAKAKLQAEQAASPYSQIAAQTPEPFDQSKVSYFKGMLDSGRINDYLGKIGNTALASDLLSSPVASALS